MRWLVLLSTLLILTGCVSSASRDPGAGGRVAFVRQGDIWVQNLPDGAPRRVTQDGGYSGPDWSPSGEWLLAVRNSAAVTIRAESGAVQRLAVGLAQRPTWAPRDDLLLYGPEQGPAVIRPDGSGQRLIAQTGPVGRPLWSPDGRWVAYLDSDPESKSPAIWRVASEGGAPEMLHVQRGEERQCLRLAGWAPGFILFQVVPLCSASITADGLPLWALPEAGGSPRQLTDAMLLYPEFLAIGPDGRLAAAAGSNRETWTNKRVVVVDPQTGVSVTVSRADLAAISPAWSSDGRLAFVAMPDIGSVGGGEKARQGMMLRSIWTVHSDGTDLRRLTDDAAWRDESPRWTADGNILFCRLDDQDQAELWLVAPQTGTARRIAELDSPGPWFGYYGRVDCARLFDYWPGASHR